MLVCQRVYLLKNVELHFQVLLFVLWNNEFSDNNDARRIRFEPPGAVPTDDLFFCRHPFVGHLQSDPYPLIFRVGPRVWVDFIDKTLRLHGMNKSGWRGWIQVSGEADMNFKRLFHCMNPEFQWLPLWRTWSRRFSHSYWVPPRNPRLSKPIAGRTPALGDMSLASPRPVPWAIWGYPKRSHVWYHMK